MNLTTIRRSVKKCPKIALLHQHERTIESTARQIELNYGLTAADEALRKAQMNLRK